jgi:hypothetical protein
VVSAICDLQTFRILPVGQASRAPSQHKGTFKPSYLISVDLRVAAATFGSDYPTKLGPLTCPRFHDSLNERSATPRHRTAPSTPRLAIAKLTMRVLGMAVTG